MHSYSTSAQRRDTVTAHLAPFPYHNAEMGYWQGNEVVMRAGALCDHMLIDGQKYIG